MDEIKDEILDLIKESRALRPLTNCYSLDVVEKSKKLWKKGNEFVFAYEDNGVNRLVFSVNTWASLDDILRQIRGGTFYLELMTKEPECYIPEASSVRAKMMRLSNADCRTVFEQNSCVLEYKNSALIENALESDTEDINTLLWGAFRTEVSHLLNNEELRKKILDGQFTVHRDRDKKIDAVLQAEVLPKKFYINQILNKSSKNTIHAILLSRLEKYIENGGKYLYAWVEDKNIASLKFHEKYGMKHDGMWSMIYRLEK